MSILADTNILLRRTQPDHPNHTLAVESVAKLLAAGEPVYFTLQNISEFWNVAARPIASNGLGFSAALASGELEKSSASCHSCPILPLSTRNGSASWSPSQQ